MADRATVPSPTGGELDRLLDNPAWHALTGPQSTIAHRAGRAVRYPVEVSVFGALDDHPDEAAWNDAATLPASDLLVVVAPRSVAPPGWEIRPAATALQMLAPDLSVAPDPEAVALGPDDVTEVMALIERTRPGPFLARTLELGDYIGIRRDGRLVAMAGERFRLPGWTEVSAVCTDESVRGLGLATRLIGAVGAGIRARGDGVLLHVASTNTNAIRLYRSLGFEERREIEFVLARAPVT